ncbi:hypothetical protein HYY74_00785 [Candidatus Woesearchaeota archaeon]|nr:hypothetical protein [Candidatus Woesearchaeota archaeon]
MTTKAVRGIREEEWAEIKAMASEGGLPISRIIVMGARELKKKKAKEAWEKVLSERPDPKLADAIEEASRQIRSRFRLREFK